jgi:hypothetical protein
MRAGAGSPDPEMEKAGWRDGSIRNSIAALAGNDEGEHSRLPGRIQRRANPTSINRLSAIVCEGVRHAVVACGETAQ